MVDREGCFDGRGYVQFLLQLFNPFYESLNLLCLCGGGGDRDVRGVLLIVHFHGNVVGRPGIPTDSRGVLILGEGRLFCRVVRGIVADGCGFLCHDWLLTV
jgi:hypothetical protein